MVNFVNIIKNIVTHREIILQLAIKNLKVRYRKPYFGFLWALIIPFCIAVVYRLVFSRFLHVRIENYPFFIYIITALLPWRYFQSSISEATHSILANKTLVNKVLFPKELLPVSIVLANLINFLPSILAILIVIGIFKMEYTFFSFLLPVVILLHTICILGLSLLFSGLQVIYRDVEYVVEVILLTLFFLTPGIYSLNLVTGLNTKYLTEIYMLNPLVGILNLYRVALLNNFWQNLPNQVTVLNTIVAPIILSFIILVAGFYIFKKCEVKFSDYIEV